MAKLSHSFVNCPRHRPGQLKLDTYSRNEADGKRQIKAKQIKSNKIDDTRRERVRRRKWGNCHKARQSADSSSWSRSGCRRITNEMKVLEVCFISDSDKPDNKQDTQSTANTPLSLSLSFPPSPSLSSKIPDSCRKEVTSSFRVL